MLTTTTLATNISRANLDHDQNQVVWRALVSGSQDHEIYLFDGNETINISDNSTDYDFAPKIDNGQVVWYSSDGNDWEIFLYDGTKTRQLTKNDVGDVSPQISDGQVIWYQYQLPGTDPAVSEREIYLDDGEKLIRLTDNDSDDFNAQFYGKQVVWQGTDTADQGGDHEIFLYDSGQTRKLTDNQVEDTLLVSEGNNILWTSTNSTNNTKQLFVYNGITTKQLTTQDFDVRYNSNDGYNIYDTDGINVAWVENREIFLYDGSTTKQITSDSFSKSYVQVSGNQIIWGTPYNSNVHQYDDIEYVVLDTTFLHDGSKTTLLTERFSQAHPRIEGESIIFVASPDLYKSFQSKTGFYIYKDGAASLLLENTTGDQRILSLSGNNLVSYTQPSNGDYRQVARVILTSWTDDTFPHLDDPGQYGASYKDLIETYGYNLDAFNQHYRQFGIAEGRLADRFYEYEYLASNPDLIALYSAEGKAAARHYIENGYREGRVLDTFKVDQYIASYSDLTIKFRVDLYGYNFSRQDFFGAARHYVEHGYFEGRNVDRFDEVSYLAANPDLIVSLGLAPEAATRHFIKLGSSESRSSTFDVNSYLASNTDLITLYASDRSLAATHYIVSGYNEGRVTSRFDPIQYIASYDDLIVNFSTGGYGYTYTGINIEGATDHFVGAGYHEGRAIDTFDEYRYMASNPDLIDYYRNYIINPQVLTEHYIKYGFAENRSTTSFDPLAYLQANSDVAVAYNNDLNQATLYYITFGYNEGRSQAHQQFS